MKLWNANKTCVNGGGIWASSTSGSSKEFSFQPEAGKDYEVASIVNQQGCAVVVFEVQADGEIKPIIQ